MGQAAWDDEGPAQVVRLGHQGTPSVTYSEPLSERRRRLQSLLPE
jgi:hypothetical protein